MQHELSEQNSAYHITQNLEGQKIKVDFYTLMFMVLYVPLFFIVFFVQLR